MRLVWFRGGWYGYERIDGKSHRTSLRTQDRAQADRNLADLAAALRRKPETVNQIMMAYLQDRGPRLRSTTARFAVARLDQTFGHLRPDQVDRSLTRAYAAQRRRQGAGDGHIRRELGVLGAALRWYDKATSAVIELPPMPSPKGLFLTREQYRELRKCARSTHHLYVFVVLSYTTAGRASAILELTWDRVDFDRGLIYLGASHLPTELRKGRATVPMTDSARSVLLEARPASLSNYVVEYAGGRVRSVKNAFRAAAERAGVPWCTPHVLRHTAAVHMAEAGVPMAEIARFLGHSSESVTFKVYAVHSPTYLRRAAQALE